MRQFIHALFIVLIVTSFASCTAFQKEPEYAYKVQNNTANTITVKITLRYTVLVGSSSLTEVIPAGETRTLWIEDGGEKGEGVTNIETNNKVISVFDSFVVQMDALGSNKNFLEAHLWQYRKENNHRATYTLTISGNDF